MKKTALILAVFIGALCGAIGLFHYRQSHRGPVTSNGLSPAERAKDLGRRVAQLVLLPPGETPQLMAVDDISQYKDRPLFTNAQNGDAILVYAAEKRVIIYRESVGKIVDIGPVTVDDKPAPPPEGALTVAIYNGSKIPELAAPVRDLIKRTFPSVYFVQEQNAMNSYGKNLVVDLTGKQAALTSQIGSLIGGDVASLPPGEGKPDADLLVIIGR